MRHKNIIIALAVLLCVLFGVKALLNHKGQTNLKDTTSYPLHLDYMELTQHSNCNHEPKIQFAVRDRSNNKCSNPLFFCDKEVKLGMSRESFNELNVDLHLITFEGVTIPADVIYDFDKEQKLRSVSARIDKSSFMATPTYLMDLLGERRVDITSDKVFIHMWYYPNSYFNFKYTNFKDEPYYFLKASSYDVPLMYTQCELALYGGCYQFEFEEAKKEATTNNAPKPTTKTYKYGDSDVYQGSSKQAEDLAAIDAYFGF